MRDRLIELILQSTQKCDSTDCIRCKYWNTNDCGAVRMADHLIKNGVVVLDTGIISPESRPLIQTFAEMPMNEVFDLVKAKQEGRIIVPPCNVGDTVYIIFLEKVIQGTVLLIRPFISKEETVFKGEIVCEIDSFFIEGKKERQIFSVALVKPYGNERIAYLTRKEAEEALLKKSRRKDNE